jgi:hypothetical protein
MTRTTAIMLLIPMLLSGCDRQPRRSVAEMLTIWQDLCVTSGPTVAQSRVAEALASDTEPFSDDDRTAVKQMIEGENEFQNSGAVPANLTFDYYPEVIEGRWIDKSNRAAIQFDSGNITVHQPGRSGTAKRYVCSLSGDLDDVEPLNEALALLVAKGFKLHSLMEGKAFTGDGVLKAVGVSGKSQVSFQVLEQNRYHARLEAYKNKDLEGIKKAMDKNPKPVNFPLSRSQLKTLFPGKIHYSFSTTAIKRTDTGVGFLPQRGRR